MTAAAECLAELGCVQITDVSATESYDFECVLRGQETHVEVKGTTSAGERVPLTRNEVAHARECHPNVVLIVVSRIRVTT
jgi:hypothetical protein